MTRGTVQVMLDFVLGSAEIEMLGAHGWFLRDGVLGRPESLRVYETVESLNAAGQLRPAGLGRGLTHRIDGAVRGDAITWIDPDRVPPELAPLFAVFGSLRDALNREAYMGLGRMEMQVARYPGGGAAYRRHRDAFAAPPGGRPNRRVTAIYYVNPEWRPEDGGALRLHVDPNPIDVAPVLDRLLVFLSERVEHEVLPARAPRRAVTAWLRARNPLDG